MCLAVFGLTAGLRWGGCEVKETAGAMQSFLKGPSTISTKPLAAKERGAAGAAGSSGEGKRPKPIPWVEK